MEWHFILNGFLTILGTTGIYWGKNVNRDNFLFNIFFYPQTKYCKTGKFLWNRYNFFLANYFSEPKFQFIYRLKYLCRRVDQKIWESCACRRILTLISCSQRGSELFADLAIGPLQHQLSHGGFAYVFSYHEIGLLKWLPTNVQIALKGYFALNAKQFSFNKKHNFP